MNRRSLKKIYYAIFKKHPYTYLGKILLPFASKQFIARSYENFFLNKDDGILQNIIKHAIDDRYYALDDGHKREMNKKIFWGRHGSVYHDYKKASFSDMRLFETEFLTLRAPLVNMLKSIPKADAHDTLCEIGTGNGIFLNYLSENLPDINKFVGLDLSEEAINKCKMEYFDKDKLEFYNMEVMDYVSKSFSEPTVFVAYDTFKYFTHDELEETLLAIRSRGQKVMIAMGEPILDTDFEKNLESMPLSFISYSHNYPHLFEKSGYTIEAINVKGMTKEQDYRLVYLMARA